MLLVISKLVTYTFSFPQPVNHRHPCNHQHHLHRLRQRFLLGSYSHLWALLLIAREWMKETSVSERRRRRKRRAQDTYLYRVRHVSASVDSHVHNDYRSVLWRLPYRDTDHSNDCTSCQWSPRDDNRSLFTTRERRRGWKVREERERELKRVLIRDICPVDS